MASRVLAHAALVAGLGVARHVVAADLPCEARRLRLASSPTRQSLRWVVRSPVALPAADPRTVGATLEVSNPLSGEQATLALPPTGWTVSGASLRFRDSTGSTAVLRERGLRVSLRTIGITLDEPAQTVLAVALRIGDDRYCSTCTMPRTDRPGRFAARRCPATPCAEFTSTTITTTTTIPAPPSCQLILQPPDSCAETPDCPPGYACQDGACTGEACGTRADCPSDGECVFDDAGAGTCVCRGCGVQACPVGCHAGFFFSGCVCSSLHDCPPEDDTCFRGVCN